MAVNLTIDPLAEAHHPPSVAQLIPVLLQYPLFASNIKLLCGKVAPGVEKKNPLVQVFSDVGSTITKHGIRGVYRGSSWYFVHLVLRDVLRFTVDRGTQSLFAKKILPSMTPQEISILGVWHAGGEGGAFVTISKNANGLQYKEGHGDVCSVLSARGDKFQDSHSTLRVGYDAGKKQLVLERRSSSRSDWGPNVYMDPVPEDCIYQIGDEKRQLRLFSSSYFARLGIRYFIDALIYPIQLLCTHRIILEDDFGARTHLRDLVVAEGPLAPFNGLTATLLMSICDDAAEAACTATIDAINFGGSMQLADKLLLRSCATQIAGVLTQQIGYCGTIQRCQAANMPGLLKPRCIREVVWNLPWSQTSVQLLIFIGLFGLNMQLLKLKAEVERQEQQQQARYHDFHH